MRRTQYQSKTQAHSSRSAPDSSSPGDFLFAGPEASSDRSNFFGISGHHSGGSGAAGDNPSSTTPTTAGGAGSATTK
ncbi:hypothetical protein PtA15_13A266 [Puccinia triticina]|uniref:Uncharacterized protein n=1 Tax=Puccinia triticina TaxID=208348 RepID=A0ABY7D3F6_9BASI|nr:uncharacterized protein PtA15_13A266 [Puccinia triticina]WAQ90866.1 hypothetical protein PtA15_13A266 [Puccinia triticina]